MYKHTLKLLLSLQTLVEMNVIKSPRPRDTQVSPVCHELQKALLSIMAWSMVHGPVALPGAQRCNQGPTLPKADLSGKTAAWLPPLTSCVTPKELLNPVKKEPNQ